MFFKKMEYFSLTETGQFYHCFRRKKLVPAQERMMMKPRLLLETIPELEDSEVGG